MVILYMLLIIIGVNRYFRKKKYVLSEKYQATNFLVININTNESV